MKFVRSIPGYDHLWAVKEEGKKTDELSLLFRQWSNFNYLLDFFFANLDDLKSFFRIEKVSDAIRDTMEDAQELERLILDFPYTEKLASDLRHSHRTECLHRYRWCYQVDGDDAGARTYTKGTR